jgi:FAD/FMN-containing dehydrogenase
MSHFDTGNFVASIGVGTVYGDKPQPPRELSAAVLSVTQRIKENFDPIGRLNPGRMVGGL